MLKHALCAPKTVPGYRSPVTLAKFQMAPIPSTLISSGSRKKEPKCACLSEAKASHSHKMCTEVSFSVPHFLQVGLLLSPITCRCLLKVLCPVRRPITSLVCVLLKDRGPVCLLCVVRGLCDGMITCLEESYRLWRVVVCEQQTLYARTL